MRIISFQHAACGLARSGIAAALILTLTLTLLPACQTSPQAVSPEAEVAADAADPQPPTPAEAYARGIEFLLSHQNADGSWGTFESARPSEIYRGTVASFRAFGDASTALCVMALLNPSHHDQRVDDALMRGVDHMLASPPVGRATPTTFYNTWAHTYRLRAFAQLLMDERFAERTEAIRRAIDAELAFLLPIQGLDGGWGYYDFNQGMSPPSGIQSTSFNTASIIVALHELQQAGVEIEPRVFRDAMRCVSRMRLPSHAYVYGTQHLHIAGANFNLVKGSLARMQPCNYALYLQGGGVNEAALAVGLDLLREHHQFLDIAYGRPRPHEAWYQNSGYYYLYGHSYASMIAATLGGETARDFLDWQSNILAARQNADGSWYDFPMYGYHRAYGTAFALFSLEHALRE